MNKPITIKQVPGGYTVSVSAEASKLYGAKPRKRPLNGNVCKAKDVPGLSIVEGLEPTVLDKETAASIAHQIGRYLLGFGDLVYAYTDTPEDFWYDGRDKP